MSIDWHAVMSLGLGRLRLSPERLWDLTPAELIFAAGLDPAAMNAGDTAWFEALCEAFPDEEQEKYETR